MKKIIEAIGICLCVCFSLCCQKQPKGKTDYTPKYHRYLDSCQTNKERIDSVARRMKGAEYWMVLDYQFKAKEIWKHYAFEGLKLAKADGNSYWEAVFLEQMYYYYYNNPWAFTKEYRVGKMGDYAAQLVQATAKSGSADSLTDAISHYLFTRKHMENSGQSAQFLLEQTSLCKKRMKGRDYKKVMCFTARQFFTYNDNKSGKIFLTKALKHQRNQCDTKQAVETKVVWKLVKTGDYKGATNVYLGMLQAEDSTKTKELLAQKSYAENMEQRFHNMLWLFVSAILLLIGGGTGYFFYHRWKENDVHYFLEMEEMRADMESLKRELDNTKLSEINNTEKIQSLERKINRLQKDMTDRLRIGKNVYESLLQENTLPHDIKGAESYLIEYVIVNFSDQYDRWNRQYQGLTPHMYTYLLLKEMGKTNDEIEHILSISASSLRSLRSRISAKERKE